MSGHVRTTALVATALLADVFAVGGVSTAQDPCETSAPPVPEDRPGISVSGAIEWFRSQGVDEHETVMEGRWSARVLSGDTVTSANVTSDEGRVVSH